MTDTSWETSSSWYDDIVGDRGHTYHQEILPSIVRLLDLKAGDHLLDVGCGQGIVSRFLPKNVEYTGIDASPSLIKYAKSYDSKGNFLVADATKKYPLKSKATHGLCLLSLQNMQDPAAAIKQMVKHVTGTVLFVLNHPCFRIPRQTSWGVDERNKIQYRMVDRYMTPLDIPIQTHPGKNQEETISFHFPLSYWTDACFKAHVSILTMEEWCSQKESTGKKARMENRARKEFPLFLAILGKVSP